MIEENNIEQNRIQQISRTVISWEVQAKISDVIFPKQGYIQNDLMLRKSQTYFLDRKDGYKMNHINLSRARRQDLLYNLRILYDSYEIKQVQPKIKKISKKQRDLSEKRDRLLIAYKLALQNFDENTIKMKAKLKSNEYRYIMKCLQSNEMPMLYQSGSEKKITYNVKNWIEKNKEKPEFLAGNCKDHIEMIRQELNLPEKWIKPSSLSKYYTRKAKLSYKLVNKTKPEMDNEETKKQRKDYVIYMIPALVQGSQPIYIDETGIKLDLGKKRAWISKGKEFIAYPNKDTRHLTILGAMTEKEVLAYTVVDGWIDQYMFMGFLSEIIKNLKNQGILKDYFFVFDQARQHQSGIIQDNIFDHFPCVLTARNSPMLNPIELLWAELKRILSKKRIPERRDLLFQIYKVFYDISSEKLKKFVTHSLKFYKKSLLLENLSGIQQNINLSVLD
ncbi:hypothetical protein ABPG72_016271 [Tetrahymena utriculariae]